jgi:hypothetical protein
MKRLIITIVSAALGLMLMAAPAFAGPIVDAAAAHLRNDPVYVDPNAGDVLNGDAAARVRAHITSGQASIFVAALPAAVTGEVGGNADALPQAIGQALGRNGAVAVVTSRGFRAGASSNSGLARGQAGELANLAFAAHKSDGPEAVLQDWIGRVQAAVAKNQASAASGTAQAKALKPHKSRTGLIVFLVLVGLVLLVVAVWMIVGVSNKRRRFRAEKSKTDSQVASLGSQVLQYSSTDDEEITEAAERYSWASSALGKARTVDDLEAVNAACAAGFDAIRRYQHKNDPQPASAFRYGDYDAGEHGTPKIKGAKQAREARSEPDPRPVEKPAPSNTTVVNNYGGSGQSGYWYGGGWYGGSYYGPGYYSSMNFWDGMLLGEMLSDHDDRDYDRDDRESVHSGGGDYAASDDSGGGDWSNSDSGDYSSGSDSGGGDWGSSDSGSSYEAPDTGGGDFGGGGSDFGGGDSGGGFDSGGGGGDW